MLFSSRGKPSRNYCKMQYSLIFCSTVLKPNVQNFLCTPIPVSHKMAVIFNNATNFVNFVWDLLVWGWRMRNLFSTAWRHCSNSFHHIFIRVSFLNGRWISDSFTLSFVVFVNDDLFRDRRIQCLSCSYRRQLIKWNERPAHAFFPPEYSELYASPTSVDFKKLDYIRSPFVVHEDITIEWFWHIK